MNTEKAAIHLKEIGQIAIIVKELDRAIRFYRDVLGMPFLFQVPGMACFQCGSVRLMLGLPEREEFDHPASIIYYRVADIQSVTKILEAREVVIEGPPRLVHKTDTNELWLAFFRDPDGNPLALMDEVPVADRAGC